MRLMLVFTFIINSVALTASYAGESITYPKNYRHWTHVKSMILEKSHPLAVPFQGIHHVYANEKALQGIQNGEFRDGAKIVFDLLKEDKKTSASVEGERVLLGIMVKDTSRYQQTGGWGFEAWKGNSQTQRLVNDHGQSCFQCHASQDKQGFVFSQWRP